MKASPNSMFGSLILYSGVVVFLVGLAFAVRPIQRLGLGRSNGLVIAAVGVLLAVIAVRLPAAESHVARPATRLDEFVPRWQFSEYHRIRVAAPAARVYDAMKHVKPNEIFLFKTLTWIRRGGRRQTESILNAGDREPLIDVAVHNGFVSLADDPPRELVIGTVVVAPHGSRGPLTPHTFRSKLPPGFALAAQNFVVTPDGPNAAWVSTETRVFTTSPDARRRFAAYWRLIYPGSAIIRRSWLRAIRKRASQ
jgi:hypothetical protein